MNKFQLEKALRLGLGRAYLHVREHGDDGVQDIILRYCLNDPRCRNSVVERLDEAKLLPTYIIEEGQFDCCDDISAVATKECS